MRDARRTHRPAVREVPVVGLAERLRVREPRLPAEQAARLVDRDERVAVRGAVVPLRERREPRELERRGARARRDAPAPLAGGEPEPAWAISASRSSRTVPKRSAPTLSASPATGGARGSGRPRRRGPRPRAAGSGSRRRRGSGSAVPPGSSRTGSRRRRAARGRGTSSDARSRSRARAGRRRRRPALRRSSTRRSGRRRRAGRPRGSGGASGTP